MSKIDHLKRSSKKSFANPGSAQTPAQRIQGDPDTAAIGFRRDLYNRCSICIRMLYNTDADGQIAVLITTVITCRKL